jgi:hypothetical protein
VVIAIFLSLLTRRALSLERVLDDPHAGSARHHGITLMASRCGRRSCGIHLRPVFAWRRAVARCSASRVDSRLRDLNQIALVVLVLANGKPGGALIYLSAYVFFQLPHGLFAVSITTSIQPSLRRPTSPTTSRSATASPRLRSSR